MGLPWLLRISKFFGFFVNSFFILTCFTFQFFIVLPEIYENGPFYYLNLIFGLFIGFNIISNLIACGIVDSSIDTVKLRPPNDSLRQASWHFCQKCNLLVPPRSWHCEICKTCIIKRDHHCVFIGCCIGHRNHRYFIIFLLYVAIGAIFIVLHSSIYFWWLHLETYGKSSLILKLFLPILLLMSFNWQNVLLFIYVMSIILAIFSCIILGYYWNCISVGATIHEYRNKHRTYDLGSKRRNFEMVLGKRFYFTWLSAFIWSELPHNGTCWDQIGRDIQLIAV